jgi:hypothetical protein
MNIEIKSKYVVPVTNALNGQTEIYSIPIKVIERELKKVNKKLEKQIKYLEKENKRIANLIINKEI